MRVPVEKGNVFGRDFDEARADFGQPAGEQAAEAEAADGVLLVGAVAVWPALETLLKSVIRPYLATFSFGSSARSNALAAGELSRRWALSIERSSDSFW